MDLDMQHLLSEFSNEASELLGKAESEIIELEKNQDSDRINAIFRYIHTVKGNSGMFEFSRMSKLAHALENLLGKYREKRIEITREVIDLMLSSVDKLKDILNHLKEEEYADIDELCNHLKSVADNLSNNKIDTANPEHTKAEINLEQIFDKEKIDTLTDLCVSEKKYVYVLGINLLEQETINTVNELNLFLNSFAYVIYDKKIVEEHIEGLETYSNTPKSLLYFILVYSNIPIEELQPKLELKNISVKILYSPIEKPIPQIVETIPETVAVTQTNRVNGNDKPTETTTAAAESYLRVKSKLLDDLINLVGETIITRNQLFQVSAFLNDAEGSGILSRMSQLITQLHEKIMHTRLQELNTINQRVNRVVRDTARNLGKQVEMVFEGGEVELDKTMIDTILDSIIHMVRNSIDHGIEIPEERIKAGKNPTGRIKLSASLQIGNIQLIIEDDGKGLDHDKIRKVAVNKGLIGANDHLSQEEIEDLLFKPGFSTATVVTETSGRGVGMDVVRTSFKKLGGSVHMRSVQGKGTSITATIPQTVTVISCLLISVDNIRYAIFQKNVSELINFESEMFTIVNGIRMYRFRNSMIPLIHLGKMLYPEKDFKEETEYIVIVKSENYLFGILFDQMLGTEEIVVKPLGDFFQELKLFAGATIMGDGEAVLILDISGVAEFQKIDGHTSQDTAEINSVINRMKKEQGFILFDIMGHRFATSLGSVICIEKLSNYPIENLSGLDVIQYKDAVIPIITLNEIYNLSSETSLESAFLIIINVDNKNLAVVINEIIDIVYEISMIDDGRFKGESVIGHAIINGHTTVVIDINDLLGRVYKHKFEWIGKHLEQISQIKISPEEMVQAQ